MPVEAQASRISKQSAHEGSKAVSPMNHRLYLQGDTPATHICKILSPPQVYSAARTITSMNNPNHLIGNCTRNLPACSAVLQPNVPPRTSQT
jgi:hypothetical protein